MTAINLILVLFSSLEIKLLTDGSGDCLHKDSPVLASWGTGSFPSGQIHKSADMGGPLTKWPDLEATHTFSYTVGRLCTSYNMNTKPMLDKQVLYCTAYGVTHKKIHVQCMCDIFPPFPSKTGWIYRGGTCRYQYHNFCALQTNGFDASWLEAGHLHGYVDRGLRARDVGGEEDNSVHP